MLRRLSLYAFLLCFGLLTLGGCSSIGSPEEDAKPLAAVEDMYNAAAALLEDGKYVEAAKEFDAVEQNYPYSQWATRAMLMSGYAHYRHLKYDEALLALDRFIELHPGDENIAYAYYLKALSFYEQISDVRRDQKMTELALDALRQVVSRFPESSYAKDAALKIDLTTDHLAGKEMEIGRYYLFRHQYQAAINRFTRVVEQYQTTTHVPEALLRLTEAYTALGIVAEAQKNAAILGQNYPNTSWYRDAYAVVTGAPVEEAAPEEKKSIYDRALGKFF